VNSKTGIVVSTQGEFKDALTKLIKDPQVKKRLGKNAQMFASKYTWEKCAQNYLKLLSKWAAK